MKYLIIIILLLTTVAGFCQKEPKSIVYILDESWAPRAATHWPTDGAVNYVQVLGEEYFVLSSRTRGKVDYFEGDIESWVDSGLKVHFWVRGVGGRTATLSLDIVHLDNIDSRINSGGDVEIHMYNALDQYDKYYSGHIASKEEMKALVAN